MPDLPAETDTFIAELDAAVAAHMNWTRRIMRCVVLRSTPGDDVLDLQAHALCHFGGWFVANRSHFEMLDAQSAARVEAAHRTAASRGARPIWKPSSSRNPNCSACWHASRR